VTGKKNASQTSVTAKQATTGDIASGQLGICAARLLEKEKINREEFEALFEGKSEESNGE